MTLNTVAWHDRTSASHQEMLNKFAAEGYRTLSLSVYGDRNDPRYASVVIKRPKVIATKQFFGLTLAQFQSKFNEMAAQGFGPYIVTATGPANDPVVAAAFKQMNPIPLTRFGLTAQEFAKLNDQAWRDGTVLAWADAYGTPDNVRFIAVWHPNVTRAAWNMPAVSEPTDVKTFQQRFNAITAQGGRLAHITITPSGQYMGLFVDNSIGAWESRGELTSEGYQNQFTALSKKGLAPVCVAVQGSGTNARFAAIFASNEEPVQRTFRATGSAAVTGIDKAMEDFLKAHDIRGAALAITQGTRLVYARGYTYAEPGYPDVKPTTLFRLASCSKTITAVAIYQLIQAKKLTLDTTMQSVLKLKTPDGKDPVDPRFKDITIRHLLESTSSLSRGGIWWSVQAAEAFKKPLPATPAQVMSYIASLKLEGDKQPGDKNNAMYNNTGYFMLSQIVAKLRNASTFESAITPTLLKPLGITRIRESHSLVNNQASDEAHYHLSNIKRTKDDDNMGSLAFGPSIRSDDHPLVPWQYGVNDYELFDGSGGLSAAMTDLARIVASFSLRDNNPVLSAATLDAMLTNAATATSTLKGSDAHGYHGLDWAVVNDSANHIYSGSKGGWMPSNQSVLGFTTGGLSYIIAINGNTQNDVTTDWFPGVSAAAVAKKWGNTDLFPQFGMQSFPTVAPSAPAPSPEPKIEPLSLMNLQRKSMTSPPSVRNGRKRR